MTASSIWNKSCKYRLIISLSTAGLNVTFGLSLCLMPLHIHVFSHPVSLTFPSNKKLLSFCLNFSIFRQLSFNFTESTIWSLLCSAISLSFFTGRASLPCNIQLLYTIPLKRSVLSGKKADQLSKLIPTSLYPGYNSLRASKTYQLVLCQICYSHI